MIYPKVLSILLIISSSCYFGTYAMSNKLRAFQKAFNEAREELQNIKHSLGLEEDEHLLRQRRRTIDQLLANFKNEPNILEDFEDGEDWYREFRSKGGDSELADSGWESFKLADIQGAQKIATDMSAALNAINENYQSTGYNYNNQEYQQNYNNLEGQHNFNNQELQHNYDNQEMQHNYNNDNYNNYNADGSSNYNFNDVLSNSYKFSEIGKRSSNSYNNNNMVSPFQGTSTNSNNKIYTRNNVQIARHNNIDYLKDLINSRTVYDSFKGRQQPNSNNVRNVQPLQPNDPSELNMPITYEQTIANIQFPSISSSNDQFDIVKNDLSHEANYKLSKIEQDASEKNKDGFGCNEPTTEKADVICGKEVITSTQTSTSTERNCATDQQDQTSGGGSEQGNGDNDGNEPNCGKSQSGTEKEESSSNEQTNSNETVKVCRPQGGKGQQFGKSQQSGSVCDKGGVGNGGGNHDGNGVGTSSSTGTDTSGSTGGGTGGATVGTGVGTGGATSVGSTCSDTGGASGSGPSVSTGVGTGIGTSIGTSVGTSVGTTSGTSGGYSTSHKNGSADGSGNENCLFNATEIATKNGNRPLVKVKGPTNGNESLKASECKDKKPGPCKPPPHCKSWNNVDLTKRSYTFNPMNEVKLLTSRRLMRKGYGASLPSYSLMDTQRELKLDELLKRFEHGQKEPEESKSDVYSKLDALMMGKGEVVPYNEFDQGKTKRLSDVRIGFLNSMSDDGLANYMSDRTEGMDHIRTKRISNEDKEQTNSKVIDAIMQQNKARTKRFTQTSQENVEQRECKNNPRNVTPPTKACSTATKTEIGDAITAEIGMGLKETPAPTTKHSICIKQEETTTSKTQLDFSSARQHSTDELLGELGEESMGQPKSRRRIMPEESNESGKTKTLKRKKRVPLMEDEIFNENVNEDIDFSDMQEHVRVKRTLVADIDAQDGLTINELRPHKRVKRVLVHAIPTSTLNINNAVANVTHKLEKRAAHMDDDEYDADNYSDNRRRTVVREDDYDDIASRKKRFSSKNFDFGAAMRSHSQEKFDNMQQNDPKLEGMKFDNLWYDDEQSTAQKVKGQSNNNKNRINERSSDKFKVGDHAKDDKNNKKLVKPLVADKHGVDVSIKTTEAKKADDKLMLSLRDEILNCSAFAQLENLLKNYKRINDNNANTGNLARVGNAAIAPDKSASPEEKIVTEKASDKVTEKPATDDSATTCEPEKNEKTEKTEKPDKSEKTTTHKPEKSDRMKLNITINASVMGDEKSNNFVGNGTINVRPGFTEDRERRSSMFPEFDIYDAFEKRRCKDNEKSKPKAKPKSKSNCKDDQESDEECTLDNLMSGKATQDILNNAFGLVRSSPKLKVLWPSLQRNKPPPPSKSSKGLAALRTPENKSSIQRTEDMMRKAMDSINVMIEKQLRSKACIPLCADLVQFYELILRSHEEQNSQRKKRENKVRSLATDFSKAVRAIDPNMIEEKSSIVKKLLRQYEELPQEEQRQATNMRDDLLMDLVYLRKIKTTQELMQERRKREIFESQFNTQDIDSEVLKKFEEKYTPSFLKLLKTADLFKEAAADTE